MTAVMVTSAELPWTRAQAQGVAPVVPGISIADIPLGMRIGEVVQRLGAPSEVRIVGNDGTLAYVFGRYGITAYTRGKVVVAISTTNSLLGTARGVGLLAPEQAVRAAFGTPRSTGVVEGFPALMYDGIVFGLDRHTVAVVMVVPSSTPAAAPPPTPDNPSPPSSPASPHATSEENPPSATATQDDSGQASTQSIEPAEPPVTTPTAPSEAGSSSEPAPAHAATTHQDESTASAPSAGATPSEDVAPPTGDAFDTTALAIAALMVSAGPAPTEGGSGSPDLSHLHPFTGATRYLSLFGYIRLLIYKMTNQWVALAR
jgi:hypothetical protein